MSNHMKYNIDLMQTPPEEDTARQYYYIEKAKKYVQKEDTILVKASHFMKFEEVVEALQKM